MKKAANSVGFAPCASDSVNIIPETEAAALTVSKICISAPVA